MKAWVVWQCDCCGKEYADEIDALWCCARVSKMWTCDACWRLYEDQETAEACCLGDLSEEGKVV